MHVDPVAAAPWERRKHQRHDLEGLDGEATLVLLRVEQRVRALALEVSDGGVRLECEPLSPAASVGDVVLVRLGASRTSRVLTLPGQIAWLRPAGDRSALGIAFDAGRDEIMTVLAPFLEAIEKPDDKAQAV